MIVRRLPVEPGPQCADGLLSLARDLDAMAGWGMVHGDLNRKNILWTEEGYRLVDFEPVLCVRRTNGIGDKHLLEFLDAAFYG